MSFGERPLLDTALVEGSRVFWSLAEEGAGAPPGVAESRRFLFRRWVLETLLVLRIQGDSSYNALSLALGGPAGESLSPKLGALCKAGLSSREETAKLPTRVVYALTPAGRTLADGVYTLTRWKGLLARAFDDPTSELPAFPDFEHRPSGGGSGWRLALDRYLKATAAIAHAREEVCRPTEFEDGLATARRFSGAWVHKWHGEILQVLALRGPQRFADVRRSLGLGDQALAGAISRLLEARCIEVALYQEGRRYAVARFGWADLALSAPLGVLVMEAQGGGARNRSTESELPLHTA